MNKHYTVADILALEPCRRYTRKYITELFDGRESLTIEDIVNLSIPDDDKFYAIQKLNETYTIIDARGSQYWYRAGQLHRDDGPARVDADGYQAWYRAGQLHRDDGPARVDADGYQAWYTDGHLHRIVDADGHQVCHTNKTEGEDK